MKSRKSTKGMAIPIVIIFSFCVLVFAGSMFFFRKEVKQENQANINFLQANFLAQAAIQHALLKIRVLPQEAYDSGVLQQGYCPFQAITADTNPTGGNKTSFPLEVFRSDCNTGSEPWLLDGLDKPNWTYQIASITVIAAYTDQQKNELVQSVQITAVGSVFDPKGGRGWRTERMTKTVEIRRPQ